KDGRLVMLVAGAPSGTGTTDTYPPLDQEVTYLFVAHSQAGAVSRYEELITIPSNGHALFNIGTRFERVVRIALDMAHDEGVEHEKEVFGTAGPTLPLVFYGQAMRQTGSVSGTTLRDAASQGCWTQGIEVADIEELMEWNTRCILRLPYKDVMAVDIAVKKSTGICQGNADVSITWERVRDDGLVI
ncbi:MAG: hypothetical protein FWD43_01670, partial [Coriobacteriia bacterium]|nr:hypothetical protein [Coriobacteriia bacterium]